MQKNIFFQTIPGEVGAYSHYIDKEGTMKWDKVKASGSTKSWNGGENLTESDIRAILAEVIREVISCNVLL